VTFQQTECDNSELDVPVPLKVWLSTSSVCDSSSPLC